MPTDPNPPATQVDTTGAGGAPGPAPSGSGSTASNTDTEGTQPGGGTPAASPPATEPDTTTGGAAVDTGDTDPHTHDPQTGQRDTTTGGGGLGSANPAYRAPGSPPAATNQDTSRTDSPVSGTEGAPTASTATNTDTTQVGGNPGSGATGVPGAPTAVSASRRGRGALVHWTAPMAVSGAPTTGFVVTSSTGATKQFPANVTSGLFDGLPTDIPVTFTVYALNRNGAGARSTASAAVTPFNPDVPSDVNTPTLPNAPTIGSASVPVAGSALVAFTPPVNDGGSDITSYTVVSTPGGLTATVPGTSTTATVTGLTTSVSYTFKVKATTAVGDSPLSAASNAVTPRTVPGAPVIGVATPGDTQASVTWTAPTSTGGSAITGYTAVSTPGGLTATVSGSTLTATITGLTNGTPYTFKVKATNAVGDSALSAASNAVTPTA